MCVCGAVPFGPPTGAQEAPQCWRGCMAFQCCGCADVKRPEKISRQVSPGERQDGRREDVKMKRPSANIGIAAAARVPEPETPAPKIDGGGGTGATGGTHFETEADSGATTEVKELMPFKRQKTRDAGSALQRRKTAAMEDYLQALPEEGTPWHIFIDIPWLKLRLSHRKNNSKKCALLQMIQWLPPMGGHMRTAILDTE